MSLLSVSFAEIPAGREGEHPFRVALVGAGGELCFDPSVTVLVGENGTGKSTLLEALAVLADLPSAGAFDLQDDPTLRHAHDLASIMRAAWTVRSKRGLFLRAEDFFGFAVRIERMRTGASAGLERLRNDFQGDPKVLARAEAPFLKDLHDLRRLYGPGLDARSHREAFMTFFGSRLTPGGLFLLDEPEAALSPMRQLALMSLLKEGVGQGSQFIIATHSPFLLAFPGARILHLGAAGATEVSFDDLEHVRLMRDFLANPSAFLRHL